MHPLLLTLPLLLPASELAAANTLTPQEIADGWILLFDGSTTFGWKVEGDGNAKDGTLVLGGKRKTSAHLTTAFGSFELRWEHRSPGGNESAAIVLARGGASASSGFGGSRDQWNKGSLTVDAAPTDAGVTSRGESRAGEVTAMVSIGGPGPVSLRIDVPADTSLSLRNVKLRPLGLKSIFNGKDLTGWKEIPGRKSRYTVTDKGELNVKNGNGDLQTEGEWDDFVLQLDIISNGKHLNSGVFFRCIPGQFWSGYESQIRNQWQGDDRTKPVDFGTGGIYNRQPSRKVVSNDHEWFTKTIVAHGNHLAVWVNGYQTADFTDTRPMSNNARQGCKLGKGPISLQGHDPTTDLSFRNIRIAELPRTAD